LMEKDSYPRFIKSELYQQMLERVPKVWIRTWSADHDIIIKYSMYNVQDYSVLYKSAVLLVICYIRGLAFNSHVENTCMTASF
jgi:hypothetical protein